MLRCKQQGLLGECQALIQRYTQQLPAVGFQPQYRFEFGALFKEQVTAFIVTALLGGVFVAVGSMIATQTIPEGLQSLTGHLSFSTRFNYLARGVVPIADVLYFVLFGAVFIVLNVTVIECRKGK